MKTASPIVILGSGGHAKSVAEICVASGIQIACFVSQSSKVEEIFGFPVQATIPDPFIDFQFAIAIGDNFKREKTWKEACQKLRKNQFPPLIHPDASIGTGVQIGEGTTIHQHASIGPGARIGDFCILNTGCSVDHDCEISDFASLAPGAIVGGSVRVQTRSALSIGSVVRHGITIGSDTVLGANSYAHSNLEPNSVYVGSPATALRTRAAHDPYL